jgi:integrase
VCGLQWDQIDLNSGRLHVRRAKGGIDNVHPLSGKEIRALRPKSLILHGNCPSLRNSPLFFWKMSLFPAF